MAVRANVIRRLTSPRPPHPPPNVRDDSRNAPHAGTGRANRCQRFARRRNRNACDTLARRANQCDVTEVADNEMSRSVVIPGRIEDASPESIRPHDSWEKWIPDSRYRGFRMTMSAPGVSDDELDAVTGGEPISQSVALAVYWGAGLVNGLPSPPPEPPIPHLPGL